MKRNVGSLGSIRAAPLVMVFVLISVPLIGLATAEGDAQWPMSHYDQGNTNSCPYNATGNDGEFRWSHNFEEAIGMPVIGSDGTLYVTRGNDLAAISSDGKQLWRSPGARDENDHSIFPLSAAIGREGCIYYATGSERSHTTPSPGGLYAVWPNGTLRWSERFSAPVLTAPRIDGQGNVLIVAAQWTDADRSWVPRTPVL